MNKLKTLLNSYFWLIVIIFLIFVGVMGVSIYQNHQEGATSRMANKQTIEANKAVREAVNANSAAVNYDADRQTEDSRREATIKPKLDAARFNSNNSKIALERARKNYNEKKSDTSNLVRSDSDNCRQLRELFPNVRFDDCEGL